jgi:hypothetical protein
MEPYNVMIKVVEYIYDKLIHKMYEMNIYIYVFKLQNS